MTRQSWLVVIVSMVFGVVLVGIASAQQFPMLDQIANKVVQKYQTSSCEQLWMEKAQGKKPESPAEQKLVQLLHSDPAMRQEFFNRVSMPITMKMFECGMIP